MTSVAAARAAEARSRWPIQASSRAGTARVRTALGRTRATKGSSSSTSEPISVVTPPGPRASIGLMGSRAAASAWRRTAALVRRAAASVHASQTQANSAWPTANDAIATHSPVTARPESPP